MNFIALLLSFYMLTMNCFPCGDIDECKNKKKQEMAATTTAEHEHEQDSCTSFCSCACCSSTGFFPGTIPPKNIALAAEQVSSICPPVHFDSYNAQGVWQPPRGLGSLLSKSDR